MCLSRSSVLEGFPVKKEKIELPPEPESENKEDDVVAELEKAPKKQRLNKVYKFYNLRLLWGYLNNVNK